MVGGTDSIQSRAGRFRVASTLYSFLRKAHFLCALVALIIAALAIPADAQQSSVSTWDAADFRVWGFIPDWAPQSQIANFDDVGMYSHVSDVIYFGGIRPNSAGNLTVTSHAQTALPVLKAQAAAVGFDLHLCMKAVTGGTEHAVWNAIGTTAAARANFVSKVTAELTKWNMKGFNFDWERPATVAEWEGYTRLALELGNAIRPLGMEISVDDYGFPDQDWDDNPYFSPNIYDQLFIMGYHYPAYPGTPSNPNNNERFANLKNGLGFTDQQLAIGFGTWGTGGPATVALSTFVAANPNLGYNVSSISGTYVDVNGITRTGTWSIESREEVRAKTKLALSRNMPGIFSWTLHYDAANDLGLHRVAHHYIAFQRGIPDLNLDGNVNATDANTLANNMGTVPGWTGTNSPAQFDDFYLSKNWEKGDRDGNGFVNQLDADWLAARFDTLDVALPDRLAYTGTFENLANSRGLTGRWNAKRESAGNLRETGNYTQHGTAGLTWSGTGVGADKRSNYSITIRNQNSADAFDGINTLPRTLSVDLSSPIDLSQNKETYFTFLVRSNTAGLLASQLSSNNRILALEFLDSAGVNQFDFAFRGLQQEFAIESQADATGQDISTNGFAADTTYLVVGKIAGNGAAANTLQASIFASGANVGNFASASFPWAITAESSSGFNPVITQLQFQSLYQASYSVSNVWIGSSADFFALPSAAAGDFNADGVVDSGDFLMWSKTRNQSGSLLPADGNGDGIVDEDDYYVWRQNFGRVLGSGSGGDALTESSSPVPEPTGFALLIVGVIMGLSIRRR